MMKSSLIPPTASPPSIHPQSQQLLHQPPSHQPPSQPTTSSIPPQQQPAYPPNVDYYDSKLPPPRYPRSITLSKPRYTYRKELSLLHPDPNYVTDADVPDRSFRSNLFDDLQDEQHVLPPPPPEEPLAQPDHIHTQPFSVPAITTLALPAISSQPPHHYSNFGNAAFVSGATELADMERKSVYMPQPYRRMRTNARRSSQMTESQRKQRHNEHTRASRSRIDRGLERLKSVIRKVRPHQKVTKKADVLQEAVKLLKEGFRLPPTDSDEEPDRQHEQTLTV